MNVVNYREAMGNSLATYDCDTHKGGYTWLVVDKLETYRNRIEDQSVPALSPIPT